MLRISKNNAKAILSNVPEDKVFWVCDGKVLRNLQELSTALAGMSEETFKYHLNKDKNDFKNWILDVIGDKKLAADISKAMTRGALIKKLNRRISQLESL